MVNVDYVFKWVLAIANSKNDAEIVFKLFKTIIFRDLEGLRFL